MPTGDTTPTASTSPTQTTGSTEPTITRNDVDYKTWIRQKEVSDSIPSIDKRQYIRFSVNNTDKAVKLLDNNGGKIDSIIDISRGGIAVTHHNSLKVGEIIPVKLQYSRLKINANVQVVTATDNRAGTQFVNLSEYNANRLLFLSLLLKRAELISSR